MKNNILRKLTFYVFSILFWFLSSTVLYFAVVKDKAEMFTSLICAIGAFYVMQSAKSKK